MATKQPTVASFEDTETRHDEMNETIESWLRDLVDLIGEARASEEFKLVARRIPRARWPGEEADNQQYKNF
ncbi:hypothetical protein ACFQO4_05390 [Saliphagus sp. GCM10025334]